MKNLTAIILSGIILFSIIVVPVSAYSQESISTKSNIITLNKKSLSDIDSDTLAVADAVVLNEASYKKQSLSDMKEVLDNGTDIIISTNNSSRLVEDFQPDMIPDESGDGKTVGYYVKSNGDDYNISTIEYGLMIDDEVSTEISETAANKYISEIVKYEPIDIDLVMSDAEKLDGVDRLAQLEPSDVAQLQVSTALGNSFMDNDKFVYFYKYGDVNGTGTDYTYSSSTSKNGYAKLGSLSFLIYAIKIKTSGTTTYDTIFATCTASGLNNKYVYKFNTSISVSENSNNKIIDFTNPSGPESSKTGTISTGINSNGEASASSEVSYTYNPNQLSSIAPIGGEKYVKTWNCTAYNDTYYNNWSWTVKPAIVLKKTDGKTGSVTAKIFVDYFRVSGGVRWYTNTATTSCGITFKNHTAV